MGIYRYQGQQDGKLRDCSIPDPEVQEWQVREHQVREHQRQEHQRQEQPRVDWPDRGLQSPHSQDPRWNQTSWHPPEWQSQNWQAPPWQAPKQSGMQRWLGRGRFLGATVKNLSVIATGSLAVLSLFALFGAWRSGSQMFDGLYARLTAPQPEPQIDMEPVLVQQLRNASELTTAVFAMQTVVPASRDRTLGGYVIGRTTLLYIAYGEVRAGVDLASLQPQDVQVNGDTISVRLPAPKILDSKIDVTRSKVYDYDRGFMGLGPDAAPELQELAEQATLQQVVEAACTQGVLQSANERAKLTVSQLLMAAGFQSPAIEVQTPPSDACTIAAPTNFEDATPPPVIIESPASVPNAAEVPPPPPAQ
ncbi:MAG: hypothetical protein Kow00121_11410 [Elainellaceae cyanobacterium]